MKIILELLQSSNSNKHFDDNARMNVSICPVDSIPPLHSTEICRERIHGGCIETYCQCKKLVLACRVVLPSRMLSTRWVGDQ